MIQVKGFIYLFEMKLFRLLFAVSLGALYGLFFAQKSGKKLRSDLAKSKDPLQDFWKELKKVGSETNETAQEYIDNSEDLQKLISSGKDQFEELAQAAQKLGGDAVKNARQEFDRLAKEAQKASKKLSTKAVGKVKSTKKVATTRAKKAVKQVKKSISK